MLVALVDGHAHIDQVSVAPEVQGQGIGRALIAEVARWAIGCGMTAVSLTTFSNVPWNMPLYERLGFRVLEEAEVGPQLRAVREHEGALGLDLTIRVCMQRDL